MTLVLGLRCRDGVVLAADSQRTEGPFREEVQKLFQTPAGIIWGTAGTISVQQDLFAGIRAVSLSSYGEMREALVRAVRTSRERIAAESDDRSSVQVEALFVWHSRKDGTHLLRVPWGTGPAEFATQFTAIGGPRARALFALSSASYMEYATVPLEGAKMLALKAADDVIRAESAGVGLPVQMAVAGPGGTELLDADDVRALEDTVAAFREYQREYLVRQEEPTPEADTGVKP